MCTWYAVTDDALAEVASQLSLQNKLVIHTAGSVSKEILKNGKQQLWRVVAHENDTETHEHTGTCNDCGRWEY
jgi:predicted nucleic acid-binding Zn finger protein